MKPTIIILAGGASTRMGAPKALVEFDGEPMVARAARIAATVGDVVVVAGAVDSQTIAQLARPARVVSNDDWQHGMASSIVAGVSAASSGPVCIWAVDQPMVTAADLGNLIGAANSADAAASVHSGKPGIPACFGPRLRPELLALTGDRGARDLLRSDRFHVAMVDTIDARDADTMAQLEQLETGDVG